MLIGIPKEIKDQEGRVSLTPEAVGTLIKAGHRVRVEVGAGLGAGFSDETYETLGAEMVDQATAWKTNLVIKVKEPLAEEFPFLKDQMLFTFLHLSGAPKSLTEELLAAGTTGLAYETREDKEGRLPLLAPMSAIAGNMAALVGAYYLARAEGGKGVQLGRVAGKRHGRVLIIGDGVVARHAAESAYGLGAEVVMAGLDQRVGAVFQERFKEGFQFVMSTPSTIDQHLKSSDVVVGAVLRRGGRATYVLERDQVRSLEDGSVIVDVSIDQGGCIATSRPTSHSHPIYLEEGVIHYCVTNMPGAYPRTATVALSEAILPYALRLAHSGLDAFSGDPGLKKALETHQGFLTIASVAEDLGLESRYRPYN